VQAAAQQKMPFEEGAGFSENPQDFRFGHGGVRFRLLACAVRCRVLA
jgi:hypothetical protein